MPWTVADAKRHNAKLNSVQSKKWASIANGVLKSCQKSGSKDCDKIAIATANKHFMSKRVYE